MNQPPEKERPPPATAEATSVSAAGEITPETEKNKPALQIGQEVARIIETIKQARDLGLDWPRGTKQGEPGLQTAEALNRELKVLEQARALGMDWPPKQPDKPNQPAKLQLNLHGPNPLIDHFSKLDEPYQLQGGSPIDYLQKGINTKDILIGDGWLERGGTFLLVAQSGIGKSLAIFQIACCWACGKGGPHAFFLDPYNGKPLRIVIIQNEDSPNDLHRQSRLLNALGLTKEQNDLVHENLWIETVRGKLGLQAIETFRKILELRKPCDILILNPLSAYASGDLTRTEDAVEFLYGQFAPLLDHYECGGAAAHHTPKSTGTTQKNKDRWSSYDFMYSGAGAAILTNFARAYITFDPKGSSQVFDVRMAKRFAESGWPTSQQLFKWAERKDCPLWVPASAAEAEQAQAKTQKNIQDLRKFVPATGEPIPCTTLEQDACKKGGFTQKAYRAVLDEARSETTPDNLRLYYWKIYNPQGGTFAAIARSPQPEDQKPDAVKARIKAEKRQAALNQSDGA